MANQHLLIKKSVCSLMLLLAFAMVISILLGQVQVYALDAGAWELIWNFRLPRVLFAAVNGAALALAGVLYQISLRNPMADGFTTGAASSAAFGGCLAMVLFGQLWLVSVFAILFAGFGIGIVRQISSMAGDGGRITIILAGIALSVVAGSGISFLKYFFEESLGMMVFWLMGGLATATFAKGAFLLLVFIGVMVFLCLQHKGLALLFLDDQSAEASGVDVRRMREILFAVTTVLVAISVSFCGVIGFLGLMVPHATRALVGHSITAQLSCAPLMGAVALVFFDLFARVALPYGGELPVGIVTSIAGGLFFFVLLVQKGRDVWGS